MNRCEAWINFPLFQIAQLLRKMIEYVRFFSLFDSLFAEMTDEMRLVKYSIVLLIISSSKKTKMWRIHSQRLMKHDSFPVILYWLCRVREMNHERKNSESVIVFWVRLPFDDRGFSIVLFAPLNTERNL